VAGIVVTVVSVLVLAAAIALLVLAHLGSSRLGAVEDPERALALVVSRTMDIQATLAGARSWERRLYTLGLSDSAAELGQAIAWYDELAAESLAPGVDLRLAVLLGEADRRDRLEQVLGQWQARGEPLESHAGVIAVAYLGAGDVDPERVTETLAELGSSWFADVLALRLAAQGGDAGLAEAARAALAARAQRLLWRLRGLATLEVGLLAVGLVAVRRWRRRSIEERAVAAAPLPPPWSLGVGLVMLVRGAALAAIALATLQVVNHWVLDGPVLSEALDQPLMYVPLLGLAWWTLLAPAGLAFVAAFGLRPRPGGLRAAVAMTGMLIAAGVVTDLVLGMVADPLGWTSHWTEGFDADLAWGGPAVVVVSLLGSLAFAPVFEELIFRGLLYGTLRVRLAWPLAALGSAVVFALAHGYGAAGFVSVFVSGLLWAWSYERTGSLLPAMAAHAANNAAVALTLTALLR
jgi:membrane protease YdiL (CAAX protease family)